MELKTIDCENDSLVNSDNKLNVLPTDNQISLLSSNSLKEDAFANVLYFHTLKSSFTVYKYRFTTNVEYSLDIQRCLNELYPMAVFDGSMIYFPEKIEKKEFSIDCENLSLKTKVQKMTFELEFVEICTDFFKIINELFLKVRTILYERYHSSLNFASDHIETAYLECWPGNIYRTGNVQVENQNFLIVFALISRKALLMRNIYARLKIIGFGPQLPLAFNRHFRGRRVISKHNNRVYFMDSLDYKIRSNSPYQDFDTFTFEDFFEKNYGATTTIHGQPILFGKLHADSNDLTALLPEFCTLIDEDNYFYLTQEICHAKLYLFQKRMMKEPMVEHLFKSWGLKLHRKFRVIPSYDFTSIPSIISDSLKDDNVKADFADTSRFANCWGKLYREPLAKVSKVRDQWFMIHHTSTRQKTIENFLNIVKLVCKENGFLLPDCQTLMIENARAEDYMEKIEYVRQSVSFVLLVFPSLQYFSDYALVKSLCCAIKIPCQFVKSSTIQEQRYNPHLVESIANMFSQINCKLGGVPWIIQAPFYHVMYIGIYFSLRKRVYGFASTSSPNAESWFFKVRKCSADPSEENENSFVMDFLHCALKNYEKTVHRFPSQVVIYRSFDEEEHDSFPYHVVEHDISKIESYFKTFHANLKLADCPLMNSQDLLLNFFYLSLNVTDPLFESFANEETVDPVMWPLDCNFSKNSIVLSSPYSHQHFNIATTLNIHHPADIHLSKKTIDYRIETDEDLYNASIIQCHLYFNSPNMSHVPAVCAYARKQTTFKGQLRDHYESDQFYFL